MAAPARRSAMLGPTDGFVIASMTASRLGGRRKSDQDRYAKRYCGYMFHVGLAGLMEFCFPEDLVFIRSGESANVSRCCLQPPYAVGL
jgi:hypothetical protein